MLACNYEPRHWKRIDKLAGYNVMLTVAILSTMPSNFSNVLRNEEIQSTRLIGLSVSLTVDAAI